MVFRATRGTTWTILGNVEYEENEKGELIQPMLDPKTVRSVVINEIIGNSY